MPEPNNAVTVATTSSKLRDGVLDLTNVESTTMEGSRVFTHYNGPTDQLGGICAGMAILAPGASPHPPHRHPEEEFLIVSDGNGEIECDGKMVQVGPGAIMILRREYTTRHHQHREDANDFLLVQVDRQNPSYFEVSKPPSGVAYTLKSTCLVICNFR